MKIKIIDQTICRTDNKELLGEFLKVKKSFWTKGEYSKQKHEYEASLVEKDGTFLAGFLPRIIRECDRRKIPLEIEGNFERKEYNLPLSYPSITLFDDQEKLVLRALTEQRGIIQSPMGTGKTIVCYAIIHPCMPCKSLLICPSKSILTQTAKKFKEMFGMNVSILSSAKVAGIPQGLSGDIVIATINSVDRLSAEKFCGVFDIVLIDESHHVCNFDGMYYKFLTRCLSPIRIGVDATPDKAGTEKGMAAEGLLGPIIGKFSFQEAIDAGRIVRPRVVLLPVPINLNAKQLTTYKEIYDVGIVFNRIRNTIIADYIAARAKENLTSVVFVKFLNHLDILYNLIKERGVEVAKVKGEISDRERENIRIMLNEKKIKSVVATGQTWSEGVDVPSLNIVYNAGGYLSEKPVLQMAGRCLRVFEGKTEGIYVDMLDSGRYLSEHCVRRLLVLAELGWI